MNKTVRVKFVESSKAVTAEVLVQFTDEDDKVINNIST